MELVRARKVLSHRFHPAREQRATPRRVRWGPRAFVCPPGASAGSGHAFRGAPTQPAPPPSGQVWGESLLFQTQRISRCISMRPGVCGGLLNGLGIFLYTSKHMRKQTKAKRGLPSGPGDCCVSRLEQALTQGSRVPSTVTSNAHVTPGLPGPARGSREAEASARRQGVPEAVRVAGWLWGPRNWFDSLPLPVIVRSRTNPGTGQGPIRKAEATPSL